MTAIGDPITRVDGHAKVTGKAKYSAEFAVPHLAYAVMVTSTIPSGRILSMGTSDAQHAPGVLAVMTSANAPKLPQGGKAAVHPPAGRVLSLLQDNLVHYNNQPIAVVVAETLNQALYASSLVTVRYSGKPRISTSKVDLQPLIPAVTGKIRPINRSAISNRD
jgi:xanthine dehydrogenase YagR molybdenum-binding subunit